ncbi:MAG: Asp/Glu racemase [Nocardioidaceae bacterium]|nr:Asp/Glu racemase [Nocardioidaceae bacterium]
MHFPSVEQTGVGVVVPHDMALDRELWRWAPVDVSLYLTRTPHTPHEVTVEMVSLISESDSVATSTRDLETTGAGAVAYACTSGSFIRGLAGERTLVEAMLSAGAAAAVTTSGAMLEALGHFGVSKVAVATPYDQTLTTRLEEFLREAGISLAGSAHLGLARDISKVPYETTAQLIREADRPEAEAVFVSCTNLPTYDVLAPLEAELGKPVISANQATMWASLLRIGRSAVDSGQRLLAP